MQCIAFDKMEKLPDVVAPGKDALEAGGDGNKDGDGGARHCQQLARGSRQLGPKDDAAVDPP